MIITYCVLAIVYSGMLIFSGVLKVQHDPQSLEIIHKLIGVPLELFPVLAACEFAGALGLLTGIRWAGIGIAAAVGLVIYFVGAIVSHVFAGDAGGIGSPGFMLAIAATLLLTRVKSRARASRAA
jgi:hypothetical protein